MVLHCGECGEAVMIEGPVKDWHPLLWDHLLDEHMVLVSAGSWHMVKFTGPNGMRVFVTERGGREGA